MTPAEKLALKVRARAILSAPVPESIRLGTARQAAQYREDAAILGAYVLRGINADKTVFALLRMEPLLQSVADVGQACAARASATVPAVHTPPSNTGVNEVSGGGRGLERGYLAASTRIQGGLSFLGGAA